MKSLENHLNIDLSALEHNLKEIKKKIFPSKVMAVIKSNAYGHGILAIAKQLEKKVAYFFVDKLKDAIILRKHSIQTPILVGVILSQQIKKCAQYQLEWALADFSVLEFLEKNKPKIKTKIHIKLDTGMGRFGFELSEYGSILNRVLKLKNVELVGVYSHLASSEDTKKKINQEQIKAFQMIITITKQKKIKPFFHLANSAAVLNFRQSYFDIVRIGLIIYGVRHFLKIEDSFRLKPVLSMHSYILSLKTIPKGRSVSYAGSWTAPKKSNIALVPIGYSDGIHWHFKNQLQVIIQGKKYSVVGNICMGVFAINLEQDSYPLGEKVTLLGKNQKLSISVEEIAAKGSSISHEVLTSTNLIQKRHYT